MQWARETKETGYLRIGFSRGFQWRVSVADCSGGPYESFLRVASSIIGVQVFRRVSHYKLSARTLLSGVIGCGAQANGNILIYKDTIIY
jgi:hypothetical protein